MVKIVATDQICEEIAKSDGVVELVDKNGRRIGILTRPPSEEDVRLAKQRAAGDGPWHTTEEVIAHLKSLDKS
jgi:hypothetical protein